MKRGAQVNSHTERRAGILGCPYRKLDPDVVMVQSSDHRNGLDSTGAMNRPMVWCVFTQR